MKNKIECLLKRTKFGKLSFCKDDLDLDRVPTQKVLECLRKHNVEHCIDCEFYKQKVWENFKSKLQEMKHDKQN